MSYHYHLTPLFLLYFYFLVNIYKNINSWEQSYHPMGDASVKILFDVEGKSYGGGFEMTTVNQQINTGRIWIIQFIY